MADPDLFLATASGENVKLWSMPNLELHSIRPFGGIVNCSCWSLNNFLLATSVEENQISVSNLKDDSTVDLSTGEEQLCLCFSSNSRYLLSGSISGAVQIWDLKHKTSRKSFKDQKTSILCATFNHNDTTIASGSVNGNVLLHNVVSGSFKGPLRLPETQAIRGIQFSNFLKNVLATASDDSAVNLWDVNTSQIIKEFKQDHKMPARGISFSPANDMLMCSIGIDKKIVFYDVVGKKTVKSINTDAPLTSVDFYHNGSTLAVGSSTGKLYLYDLRAGSTPMKTAVADRTTVKTVSFQRLVTKSYSKGLSRRGSNSSIGSTASNKSREGPSDFKEAKTTNVVVQEEQKAAANGNEPAVFNQPGSSLFSPLRSGDVYSTGLKNEDSEIVPMETMRAELLRKTSILTGMYSDKGKNFDDQTEAKQPDTPALRLPDRSNLRQSDKSESRPKDSESIARPQLSKTSEDSRVPSERDLLSAGETQELSQLIVNDSATPRKGTSRTEGTDGGQPLHQFQVDFIRNMIEDSIEDTRESMHRGFLHLQAEMLRQFHLQQEELRMMMEQMSPNQQLIEENARLKEEVKRLKTNF